MKAAGRFPQRSGNLRRWVTPRPAHTPEAPAVEVVGLTAGYDGRVVLEEVTFALPPAQRLAVVGPNGAGKTTLLRVLSGSLAPLAGEVRVFGHDPCEHVCIAYVPQRSQVDLSFPVTVEDVVMMGRLHKIGLLRRPGPTDRQAVQAALERAGLADLRDRPLGGLSGGQQQRAFLARALAQEAELILLDEPFVGLDAPSWEVFFETLDRLRAEGVTILVTTHDLNLAADRFDRALLLNRRVIAYGPPTEVFTPENLRRAYEAHLHLLPAEAGVAVLTDTHCGDEDEA